MADIQFDYTSRSKLVEVKDLCKWFPLKLSGKSGEKTLEIIRVVIVFSLFTDFTKEVGSILCLSKARGIIV
ncbi:MAG: hypothetical protein II608_07280, partial [Oscillospiraceae bacterium]|nr:hypothetical protein [Oscillospiraceae bacterium]